MAEPTIIFVPGFWEGPTIFAPVISKIESEYGYHTSTVTLPSTGTLPPSIKTFADDVKAIQRAIENHVEEGRDVIVIAHSAGGFLSSEAVKGLSVKDRSSLQKKGGVRKMIFLTGMLIPEGTKHQNDQPFFNIQVDLSPLEELRSITERSGGWYPLLICCRATRCSAAHHWRNFSGMCRR